VKSSFQGSGGHLARFLANRPGMTKAIYDASRTALCDHWGMTYPHAQALDDDQNSTVLEFLWVLMALWQEINDVGCATVPAEAQLRIEQKFASLQRVREF
jgi:hypothetical protein